MRDIFIFNEIRVQGKIYFGRHFAWLKYFTYHLVPVWLRTTNITFCRWIKLEKYVIHQLTLCQMCLFEFIRVEGGVRSL
jgi:hypothetical protein